MSKELRSPDKIAEDIIVSIHSIDEFTARYSSLLHEDIVVDLMAITEYTSEMLQYCSYLLDRLCESEVARFDSTQSS